MSAAASCLPALWSRAHDDDESISIAGIYQIKTKQSEGRLIKTVVCLVCLVESQVEA